jgi:integrase/recombinase XerD
MKEQIRLSFYLDNRRKKATGFYPVKLRLYQPATTKEKLFRTGYDLNEPAFTQCLLGKDPDKGQKKLTRKEKEAFAETTIKIEAVRDKAKEILADMVSFDFAEFERKYFDKSSGRDMDYYFALKIEQLNNEGGARTADVYRLALARLKDYLNTTRKKPFERVPFDRVTPDILRGYEKYYLKKGRSPASIGIYLRPVRTIFNMAIADKNSELKADQYPFGKHKYTPPTGHNVKKALSPAQLQLLFELEPENEYQKKAKAFWFFSYLANGMNFKDIAELKYKNLNGNRVAFYRSKTKSTTRSNPQLIQAILPEFAQRVIAEYGNPEQKNENYIFSIIEKSDTPAATVRKIKGFTRFVNQHVKKMAAAHNARLVAKHEKQKLDPPTPEQLIPEQISTYWARHSFTTQAIRKGATMELLQESLGHKNLATTQNYFAGFTTEVKENLANSLLEF